MSPQTFPPGPTSRPVLRIWESGTGRSTPAAATPISTPRPGMKLRLCFGFTYNFINPATQYQNGVDMHLDWGASQFLTKQWQVGLVGYVYQEVGWGGGSGR